VENVHAVTETRFQPISWWTFGAVLSTAYSSDRLNLKTAWRASVTDTCYRKRCHSLWKWGGRRGCIKMAHPLFVVVLSFPIEFLDHCVGGPVARPYTHRLLFWGHVRFLL
jgi:hypothetical protein